MVQGHDYAMYETQRLFNLLPDVDFVHDIRAVEIPRPSPEELDHPVSADCALWRDPVVFSGRTA